MRHSTSLRMMFLLWAGCTAPDPRTVYLGPPGTLETHGVVEVHWDRADQAVWRLRSVVDVDGHHADGLLPADAPTQALALPTTYAVVAKGRRGTLNVDVQALGQDGFVVARGKGSAELVENDVVHIFVGLEKACLEDGECSDGVWCNGQERCREGVCAPGADPCPPSTVSCVKVSCLEQEATCNLAVDHAVCRAPLDGGDGAYCDPALGCLAGRPDSPFLENSPEPTPALGRQGTPFRLAFTASEPLAATPLVRVDVGGRRVAWLLDELHSLPAARHWEFTYTADGSEQPGRRPVTVDLVDLAGNGGVGLAAGSITLDFTAPALVGNAVLTPAALKEGATATLHVNLGDDVGGPPEVRLVPLGQQPGPGFPAWTAGTDGFTYVATGDEPEGQYAVWVRALDGAGNDSGYLQAAVLRLDFTAPQLAVEPAPKVIPPQLTPGRTVSVEVSVQEPVVPGARLVARRGDAEAVFDVAEGSVQLLRFFHAVTAEEQGQATLVLQGLADAAGNVAEDVEIGVLTVDGLPPGLRSYTQSAPQVNAGDTLTIQLTPSEPLGAAPVVRLAGRALSRVGTGTEPYAFALRVAESGLVGHYEVSVEVEDLLGNRAVLTPGTVDVDAVPPTLLDAAVTPALARAGSTVYLSVTASESLVAAPQLHWDQDPGFHHLSRSGLTDTFVLDVTGGGHSGTFTLTSVRLTDGAGNVTDAPAATVLSVDDEVPVILRFAADQYRYSLQPGFNTITLSLDVSEPPTGVGVQLAGQDVPCGPYQAAPPNVTCTFSTGDFFPPLPSFALLLATAQVADAAGNSSQLTTPVQYDSEAPTVLEETVGLQLVPGADNVLTRVSAARAGTTVRVSFALSEAAYQDPVVRTDTTPSYAFTLRSHSGTGYIYELVLDAGVPDRPYAVTVSATDDVGNTGESVLPLGFQVDQTAPIPASVDVPDQVVYLRAPWGTEASAGDPRMELHVAAGAVEGLSTVIVYSAATSPRAELGRAEVGASAVVVPLAATDRREVYVAVADSAGNVSPVRRVRDVRWVATLAGKVPDSVLENPHQGAARLVMTGGLGGGGQLALPDLGTALVSVDGQAVPARGTGRWEKMAPLANVSRTYLQHALVWDGTTGAMTLIGTHYESTPDRNFWDGARFEGGRWRPTEGPFTAGELGWTTAAFDDRRQRLVVLMQTSTWEWDGGTWHKVALTDPEGDGNPPARQNCTMVYIASQGRMLLYGGSNMLVNALADTWTYDGVSWRHETDQGPGARVAPALGYDRARDKVVLFGGSSTVFGASQSDTWEWDGAAWSKKIPVAGADGNPGSCRGCVLDYDVARNQLVLGAAGTGMAWSWDGVDWQRLAVTDPDGDGNPQLAAQSAFDTQSWALAADPWRGTLRLLGNPVDGFLEDWEWNGGSWARLPMVTPGPDGVPDPAASRALVYDPASQTTWLFFGGVANDAPTDDTWRWDGLRWTKVVPTPSPQPSARARPNLVAETAASQVLLFGGEDATGWLGDTWTFANGTWTPATPVHAPTARRGSGMAHDPATGVTWMYGGNGQDCTLGCAPTCGIICDYFDDLWQWTGGDWTVVSKTSPWPPPLLNPALAFDETRQRLVLFGGVLNNQAVAQDTWEWTGTGWTKVVVTDPEGDGNPIAFDESTLFYSAALGRVVLATACGSGASNDLWTWEGTSWKRLPAAEPLGSGTVMERCLAGRAWNPAQQRLVMVGGELSDGVSRQTWEWHVTEGERPAVQLEFSLRSAGMAAGSTLRGVQARAVANGQGWVQGVLTPGAQVLMWRKGRSFERGPVTAAGPGSFASAALRAAAPLTDSVVQDQVHVAVVPVGANTPGGLAEVNVDYVELVVDYQLP